MNYKTDLKRLGSFTITGQMRVSDPCYKPEVWCSGVLNTKPGVWEAAVMVLDNEVGDYALVKSNNGYGSGNYGVVKVVGIEPTAEYAGTAPTAEILCKVDLPAYEKHCEMRANRTALKKKMDKMVKDSQELLVYQTIANTNPEMAELLAAYRETLSA